MPCREQTSVGTWCDQEAHCCGSLFRAGNFPHGRTCSGFQVGRSSVTGLQTSVLPMALKLCSSMAVQTGVPHVVHKQQSSRYSFRPYVTYGTLHGPGNPQSVPAIFLGVLSPLSHIPSDTSVWNNLAVCFYHSLFFLIFLKRLLSHYFK